MSFLSFESFIKRNILFLLGGVIILYFPVFASSTSYDDYDDFFHGKYNFISQKPLNVRIDIYDKNRNILLVSAFEITSDTKVEELKESIRNELLYRIKNRKLFNISKKEKKLIKKFLKKRKSIIIMKDYFLFADNQHLYQYVSHMRSPSLKVYLVTLR